jgi:dihydroorotate dehydrogenase electron transfer subunit
MNQGHRQTIFVEDAEVLSHTRHPAEQFILRLAATECAQHAMPGSFVHLRCGPDLPMRRPLSIMRCDPTAGWIEILYKIVGKGLRQLSLCKPGSRISILGPIGQGFQPDSRRPIAMLIGGGVGIPPLVFLAEYLHTRVNANWQPLGFFGSEIPFPFTIEERAQPLEGVPDHATAGLALLDLQGVPTRLASQAGYTGCWRGYVTALAETWLANQAIETVNRVTLYACGPNAMLQAAQRLAEKYSLPSQLCLEEFMACGVGGCAGCGIMVQTPEGRAMKRVCVDGPVFQGETIFPPAG